MELIGAIAEATNTEGFVERTVFKNIYTCISVHPEQMVVPFKNINILIPSMKKILCSELFIRWFQRDGQYKNALLVDWKDEGFTDEQISAAAEEYANNYEKPVKVLDRIDEAGMPKAEWGSKRLMTLYLLLKPDTVAEKQFILLPPAKKAQALKMFIIKKGIKPEAYAEALS